MCDYGISDVDVSKISFFIFDNSKLVPSSQETSSGLNRSYRGYDNGENKKGFAVIFIEGLILLDYYY